MNGTLFLKKTYIVDWEKLKMSGKLPMQLQIGISRKNSERGQEKRTITSVLSTPLRGCSDRGSNPG